MIFFQGFAFMCYYLTAAYNIFILYTYLLGMNSIYSFHNLCSRSIYVNIGVFVFALVVLCFIVMALAPKRLLKKTAQRQSVSVQETTSSKQPLRRQAKSREVPLKKPAAWLIKMRKATLNRLRKTAAASAALPANITHCNLHKAEAASGASFDPAANAIARSRHKVRVGGFFGKRHWVAPGDIVAFQKDID